jgi:hypothetical protein
MQRAEPLKKSKAWAGYDSASSSINGDGKDEIIDGRLEPLAAGADGI